MVLLMAGGIIIPYVTATSTNLWQNLPSWSSKSEKTDPAPVAALADVPAVDVGTTHVAAADRMVPVGKRNLPPLEGAPAQDLSEVLRLDVTSGWIMQRWPRVTSGLAELDLQGYRVPLVTGTREDDLAGSLTYYFDREHRLERITFRGTTGDPRKLVSLMTSKYQFLRQPTNDPGLVLYQVKWNGKPRSELRIRPARVVRADAPYSRYDVDLALRR
jgi:hypothetical protein